MTPLDSGSLQAYLDHRLGKAAVRVIGMTRFTRGVSRETWGIDIENLDGTNRPTALILRRALDGAAYIPRTLRFEYEIAARLAKTDVPVAHPLWYEDDPRWTFDGREFFIREQIEGSWNVPHAVDTDPRYDTHRIAISKEMIEKLAMVHSVDWEALDFGAILGIPDDLADSGPRAIRQIYDELSEFQFEPQPVLEEVREWLLDNAPPAEKIVLLKGTNGLGEEVFRDNRIVALSDWEQCSLGDAAQDFARTQDLLPDIVRDGKTVWSMQHALEYYENLTGTKVTVAAVDYYRLLGCVEGAVYFHSALRSVVDGTDPNIRRAYLATELSHNFLRKLLDAVYGRNVGGQAFGTLEAKEGAAIVAADP
jgi:aminoglycoside phosphotransferase (APT) family kinase protein